VNKAIQAFRSALVGKALSPAVATRGWRNVISESFPGAWQRSIKVDPEAVLAYSAVFAAMTLIASDVAKIPPKLKKKTSGDVWLPYDDPVVASVLRKPNGFQTRIQFYENWILSKLSRGNTYVLKSRDRQGRVTALFVLDPTRVRPMISATGEVFYEAQPDDLSGLAQTVLIPADEVIHDRFNCLFHPLVGLSPIYACGLAATQGLAIQANSTAFFGNASTPSGVLTAPGRIGEDTAERMKRDWDENFSGRNAGKVAVLGDGLKYEALSMSPHDSQMIEQLKWTAEVVCSTFHVPPYKIGVGALPSYNNVQALNVEYYSQCLQVLFESIEVCLDEGLRLDLDLGVEFDLEYLLRMDSTSKMNYLEKGRNLMTPNEARARLDLPPKPGGDQIYRQQQDYSLEALSKRDESDDPFKSGGGSQSSEAGIDLGDQEPDPVVEDEEARALEAIQRGLTGA
jgi:HK97 family phage portal protein